MGEISNNPILNRKHYYDFVISNHDEEYAIIHYWSNLKGEEDATVTITNQEKMPVYFRFAMNKLTDYRPFLLNYLKGRLTPLNRMFLYDQLVKEGIDPNDWITRLKLCGGRHMEDNDSVEVIDLGFGDT